MRFLLFLILVWFPYVEGQCGVNEYAFQSSSCNADKDCEIDPKTKVSFGKGRTYCSADTGGVCCFKENVCSGQSPNSAPLLDKSSGQPFIVVCRTDSECETASKKLNEPREFVCQQNTCCSKKVVAVKVECKMGGTLAATSCTVDSLACGPQHYCEIQGCCPRNLCAGSKMLPMHNVSRKDRLEVHECSDHHDCNLIEDKYPNSYCSTVEDGQKFCCPFAYSKTFRDTSTPQSLLPTGFYNDGTFELNKIFTKDDLQGIIDNAAELFKACEDHSDCGEDEFCDDAVHMDKKYGALVESMQYYHPRLCFPAPRCAGRAVRDVDSGIKLCSSLSGCNKNVEFCDTESNVANEFKPFSNLGVCCEFDCTVAIQSVYVLKNTTKAFVRYTESQSKCTSDSDCYVKGKEGLCTNAKDTGTPKIPNLPRGIDMKLCCLPAGASKAIQLACLGGEPNKDVNGRLIRCYKDEDCNHVSGQALADRSKWDFECVAPQGRGRNYCCPVAKCDDHLTYMKTEMECNTNLDCLKDEDDQTTHPDSRALCLDYHELNRSKNKRCCPIGDSSIQLPYCTKRNCTKPSDCGAATTYCHPQKKTCCFLGKTRLDGTSHVNSTSCQTTCPDREIFGSKAEQFCVMISSKSKSGMCFLSPYTIIKDRERRVNPIYKTILIISIILTLVFAFLALIMFVNYRSKNFCDKYTPKKKKSNRGKKGKTSDSTSTGGKGDSSVMSGTSTGGGTTGDGTTGDGTTGGTKTGG